MTDCPCDKPPERFLRIPAGLPALPRQTQAFPEVRIALLAEVAKKTPLDGWQARGERDFGVMWLEMWAYVADVLGFYDERIANESYIRTAVRRPSLRRIVDLLGYLPAPGVAGSATIAAIAEGRTPVAIPQSTGIRSDAFGNEAPQVFEVALGASIHTLKNSWEIGPVEIPVLAGGDERTELILQTANNGLAKNRIVVLQWPQGSGVHREVRRVTGISPFEGKDGKTYLRATISSPISIPSSVPIQDIQVQTPTVSAILTKAVSDPISTTSSSTTVQLDTIYRQLHTGDVVVSTKGRDDSLGVSTATDVIETTVTIPPPSSSPTGTLPTFFPLTKLTLDKKLEDSEANRYSFQFALVDAGKLATVADTEPSADTLQNPDHPDGVLVTGIVERPPEAVESGVLSQKFLLRDADTKGVLVDGVMTFNDDGTARFRVASKNLPPTLKTPIAVFGNVLEVSRGESVFDETLGDGDPRQLHQAFKLSQAPLTYIFDPSVDDTHARSTLEVRVDGVRWHEVRSFFGRGPQDRIYIVRTDDEGETFVIFGDGVRGARVPSGIQNVRASYRFGSGEAAPPANAIKQLAKAVKGLRRVESPIDAVIGKNPDPPELLRTAAPRSALLFKRAVSTLDFEALASLVPGVIKATAEFLWIPSEHDAGVVVTYIGSAADTDVLAAMRKEAEPNLPLVAQQAEAWSATLTVEVEVHPDLDAATVAAAAKAALIDEETGPLSKRNAPIGQQLFRSVIFDAIHDVTGVVAIRKAKVVVTRPNQTKFSVDFKRSNKTGVCAGANAYLDFTGGVTVTGSTAQEPALGVELIPP